MKKIVLITGGSEGLGKEIAKRLVPNNQVIILSHNEGKLQTAAKELDCDYVVCDVTKYDQVEKTIATIIGKYGKIDVLVNNAGIWIEGELDANNPELIHQVLEVNTLGMIYCAKAVIPGMKKEQSGTIVNVVSQAGLKPKEERSVYTASKYAITGFTDSLNLELAKHKIGVAGIYPYKMKTQMFEKAGIHKDMEDAVEPIEVAKAVEFILSYEYPNLVTHLEIKHNGYKNKVK